MKSKLYRLKSWLTLEEAASHLSTVLSEDVKPSDILQLGMEGNITLSVDLVNGASVKKGETTELMELPVMLCMAGKLPVPESKREDVPPGSLEEECLKLSGKPYGEIIEKCSDAMARAVSDRSVATIPLGDHAGGSKYVRFKGDIFNAVGVWDLPMLAGEEIDVRELYQELTGGPEVDLSSIDGAWLKGENGRLYCIQERFDREYIRSLEGENVASSDAMRLGNPDHYYPAGRLPEGSTIVIRRENLDAFIASLEEPEPAPVSTTGAEKSRTLEVLGLLVELYADRHGPDYRHGARPKASRIVQDMLSAIPDDVTGMGDRKLKEHVGAAITAWETKKRR